MKIPAFISWLLIIVGAAIYIIGLWYVCPLLNGKGYFLGVLMTGMFVTYVYLREEMRERLDARFTSVCQMVMLITVGLLVVGVWNAPLLPVERVVYLVAFFICLLGQFLLLCSSKNRKTELIEK
ncbi:TPA_asm: hypothetical protein GNC10_002570 [Salmonella enterica subsp. salamae serovar 42:z:1,5]|uniref:YiaAB two helix domain-containing protein n=2 Tax=Salmonella enterica TaxID=28901 RepID=A0A3I8FIP8_SALER|nr:hypothetical protein [Salmonella enterica subsp. salamae]EEN0867482.1 hypothetical protein [Salmonella enterica]HAE7081941.1 hypothetical protein [Salmonella enterica subsp. salamae serovar 42:z:1,5]HER1244367.1 hypothetical protein [Salmonella enterica subsp. salamae serovar 48:z:e,n,x,z15]ECJ2520908.1 hypothetical protein [Salmonella enterica subsp. salamae]